MATLLQREAWQRDRARGEGRSRVATCCWPSTPPGTKSLPVPAANNSPAPAPARSPPSDANVRLSTARLSKLPLSLQLTAALGITELGLCCCCSARRTGCPAPRHGLISASPFLPQPISLQSGDGDLMSSLVTSVCWPSRCVAAGWSCAPAGAAALRAAGSWGCGLGFAGDRGWQLCPGNQAG